jgi:hypothetical protein
MENIIRDHPPLFVPDTLARDIGIIDPNEP